MILLGATLPSYDFDKDKDKTINMDDKDNERYLDEIDY